MAIAKRVGAAPAVPRRERAESYRAAIARPLDALDALARRAAEPVDGSSAAVFRIAFGVVALAAVVRFFAHGWIDQLYVDPAHHFSYVGFEWARAWPAPWMHIHFAALGLLALAIMLGWRYRAAALLFTLGFSYVELIDKTTYLNHYYFVSLAGLLLFLLPAHRVWSLDARRGGSPATVPRGAVWALRAQVALVYCFAGLAKLNADWLLDAAPLRIWLPQHADAPIVGPLLDELWVAYAFSWAGAAFDLTIVAWLLWRRSRPFAWVMLAVFHLITGQLFMIGVFPWLMTAAAPIFFAPDWPRRLAARLSRRAPLPPAAAPPSAGGGTSRWMRAAVLIGLLVLAVQIAVPLRHYLYPGSVRWNEEGYRFSWRVLLTEKVGMVDYRVTDRDDGRTWHVDPSAYLTPLQEERMTTQPDLILATAHFIRDDYAAAGLDVEVRADAFVSLNGRAYARLIDPETDLARERQGIGAKGWILPQPP